MNFVYDRDNVGMYPLNYSSRVRSFLGYELHREVTYHDDDIRRHWYVVSPQDTVAIIPFDCYNEVTKTQFEEIVYECCETNVVRNN
ncbi:hypothetical protein Syn7803C72_40 [Synechococcus phage ACG-2014d]|jgi:hypothetical protein|uniref:Uncharacterized protein n=1 Tax=Synechococcus phage ACG-2014d TaxID=1493509 RepID=A0A0E3EQI9_9CAUD|nr:hypothetical protein AAJ59_gp040 [Synechococcus phage ACG-2014d]YP_010355209.1 hypothetical protein M1M12_gp040 [Synechococcus phage ACG-2014d]AIX14651.1 hypothetical protein Syn7803C45_40 [Synechococcus phage ACG-2014d]AIX14871.1 hypothetical protein Syn7803C46_40 [Synechococcus phage ACG-2014d]AIX15298.1 hypothetical protein Syn7803C48_40 [Synechococcus phage ACG-2014d]AIX15516.1 hypothetical protein Syn7803C49_40 [Synechococcus phage ACG-2014d]AIX15945.1 hypothetical protein Syn7803C54_